VKSPMKTGLVAIALAASLTACTNPYDPGQRALGGAAIGAGGGALLGSAFGGGRGAGIGALAGGAVGAVTGAATTPPTQSYPAYAPPPAPVYAAPAPVYVPAQPTYAYPPGYYAAPPPPAYYRY